MKLMKKWKQTTKRAMAFALGTMLVMGNIGSVSYAEQEVNKSETETIGYSAARVEEKDLSGITTYTTYRSMSADQKNGVTEIKIGTAQELWDFSQDFNNEDGGYDGKIIYLENDIKMNDINQIPMAPIGYYNDDKSHKTFKGTFDGQGHEIDVVIDDATHNGVGLFGAMGKGTVKNLILSGSVSGQKHQVGGIVGIIVGGSVTIENCYNKANVISTYKQSQTEDGKSVGGLGQYIGGIVGFINGGTNHEISNCTNEGKISAMRNVGGIAGGINSSTAITNCRNIGEVQAEDWGNISSEEKAKQIQHGCGGIVGILKNNPTTITNCINDGRVRTWACTAAGIVGNVQVKGCVLSEVYNYGEVKNTGTGGLSNSIYCSYLTDGTSITGALEKEALNAMYTTNPDPENADITNAAINADTSIVSVTKDIVGYSDARVVGVDLTNVMSMTEYLAADDTSGVTEVQISKVAELKDFASNCASKSGYSGVTIYLANDIDMTGQSMTPVGTAERPFQGTFDGQGHEIVGIKIDGGSGARIGFFGVVLGATIKNLILQGQVSSQASQVGGFVGNIDKGAKTTIDNCYSKVDATGVQYVGGIVGMITSDGNAYLVTHEINNCTVAGNKTGISGTHNVGGIVGGALNGVNITDCRNAAKINASDGTATTGCGGIVGICKNWASTIDGCINDAQIIGSKSSVSGIVGYIEISKCNISDCINYDNTANPFYSVKSGCTVTEDIVNVSKAGETDESYEVATTYADTLIGANVGSNRKEIASITEDIVGYSDARVVGVELKNVMSMTDYLNETDTSVIREVKISTSKELQDFANNCKSKNGYKGLTIYLTNDIDMTGQSMTPIGTNTVAFQGTFDGQGYEIIGLSINKESTAGVGLFAYASSGAIIKNLILSGTVNGAAQVGSIAGNVNAGQVTIENCYNKSDVTGTLTGTVSGAYVGGIVGMVNKAEGLTVSNCTNKGTVQGKKDVGGLVGGALSTTNITNSRNIGTVTATAGATANGCGGLVGIVKTQPITISGSINNGAVAAGSCTGAGIVGMITLKKCSIADTINYGTVTAAEAGVTYSIYGMTSGIYINEDGFGMSDKSGETDPSQEAAIAEGTKHEGWILGDANDDGEVDLRDLVRIKRHAADSSVEIKNISCADTSRDNAVTDADAGACRIVLLNHIFYAKDLENLTVLALGDSYFAGQGLPQDQVWIHLMARKYNMDMKNYGIGGSTVSDCENGANPMVNRYNTLITENPTADIILVEGGRNDSSKKAAIGDITLENQDKTTYVGALNVIIDDLQKAYPNAMIVCLTPWNFPDREGYLSSQDYGTAMEQIAALQGVKCIRAYDPEVSGVNMQDPDFPKEYSMAANDVSHLNLKGMKIVMPRFEKLLAEYWEEFKNAK